MFLYAGVTADKPSRSSEPICATGIRDTAALGHLLLENLGEGTEEHMRNGSTEAFMGHLSVFPKILARDLHSFGCYSRH